VSKTPTPAPPKEVKKVEPPKPVEKKVQPPKPVEKKVQPPKPKPSEPRKSPQVEEPAVPAGGDIKPAEPRRTDTPAVERVSTEAMRAMPLEDRLALFKLLNRNAEKFVAIRRELPKKGYMRKDEALLRNIIPEKAPKVKNATVYYCPYCVDWQVFHYHNWTGYNKCTGCGITTKDMYTGIDNGIFGKE